MTTIFGRYKIIIIVLAILIVAFAAWIVITENNSTQIPSKGVFVFGPKMILRSLYEVT